MNLATELKTHVHCCSTIDPRFSFREPRLGSDRVQHEMKNKGNVDVTVYFSFKETGKNRLSECPIKGCYGGNDIVCDGISVLVNLVKG
jgi:hypothetical protein